MMDTIIKNIVNEKLLNLETTQRCRIISTSPISIKPILPKKVNGKLLDYPVITNVSKIKGINLEIGDTVIVAFNKFDMTDAVILGVIE